MLEKNKEAHIKKNSLISNCSEKLFNNIEINASKQSSRIAFINLIVGCLWILLSDNLVKYLIKDQAMATYISIIKGWIYVLITSLAIFLLVFSVLKKVMDLNDQMRSMNGELEKRVVESTSQLQETNDNLKVTNALLEKEVEERKKAEDIIRKHN